MISYYPHLLFFVATALVFMSLGMLGVAVWSKSWPSTSGTIKDVITVQRKRWPGGWVPVVVFQYEVNGREFVSTRSGFYLSRVSSEAGAGDRVGSYAVGQAVKVSYLPLLPRMAVLRTGPAQVAGWLLLAFISALLSALGAWLAWG